MTNTPKALFLALGVILVGMGAAKDSHASYSILAPISCGDYLDAYSKSTLTGDSGIKGRHEFWEATGYINGMITGINHERSSNVLKGMSLNQSYKWIASWCRDNMSANLATAVSNLVYSRK
jgi:hypothetical protein